ncbi:MAG: transglycosylase domain-containing protein, partial [Microgenomates group bacterium]
EEASLSYFGKDVQSLNLSESAFLAGLPKSPTKYSPFGQDPNAAFARQKEVLHLMKVNKFITPEQEEEALNQRITFISNKTEIKAPHFVMYIRQLLVDMYGEDLVEKGGLEVTTTLDLGIQELVQKVVTEEVDKLKGLHVGNGAALVLNPKNGEILAMVGSRDYFDTKNDGNVNVTLRLRQPGSSIKIVNYAYALSHGYTPSSIIDDSPVTFVTPGTTPYAPKNYDGKFKGKVSLRVALAESRNIPAVKVLASYGVSKMLELGQEMGITTWEDSSLYGLSLTLGGGATKLIELAQVYATVANGGVRPEIEPILQIKNYKGKEIWKSNINLETQVLDPKVAYMLIDILKDNGARAGEFGTNSYLVVKNHPEVAVKTGTSNDLRDNLTAGFNQDYLVVTWVGNNDNSPMSRIASGVTGASPIWNKIISAILSDKPSIDWKSPEGLVKVNICTITGTLPCNGCPTRQEWFKEGEQPKKACTPEAVQAIIDQKQQEQNSQGQILDDGIHTQNP